jgi:hypothetical protein
MNAAVSEKPTILSMQDQYQGAMKHSKLSMVVMFLVMAILRVIHFRHVHCRIQLWCINKALGPPPKSECNHKAELSSQFTTSPYQLSFPLKPYTTERQLIKFSSNTSKRTLPPDCEKSPSIPHEFGEIAITMSDREFGGKLILIFYYSERLLWCGHYRLHHGEL